MSFLDSSAIFEAWKSRWDQSSTLATLVPGGIYQGPVADAEDMPYASLSVDEGEPQWTSGEQYWQQFTVEVSLWSPDGISNLGTIASAIHAWFQHNKRDRLSVAGSDSVLSLRPMAGQKQTDGVRKEGQNILQATFRFALAVQGSKS